MSFLHILTLKHCCAPFPPAPGSFTVTVLTSPPGRTVVVTGVGEEVAGPPLRKKKKKKLLTAQLSGVKWPWRLQRARVHLFLFYKKAESSVAKRGITDGREMMGGGLPTPGVFGKASPQIGGRAGRGGGPPPATKDGDNLRDSGDRRDGTRAPHASRPAPPPHSSIRQEQGREVS